MRNPSRLLLVLLLVVVATMLPVSDTSTTEAQYHGCTDGCMTCEFNAFIGNWCRGANDESGYCDCDEIWSVALERASCRLHGEACYGIIIYC